MDTVEVTDEWTVLKNIVWEWIYNHDDAMDESLATWFDPTNNAILRNYKVSALNQNSGKIILKIKWLSTKFLKTPFRFRFICPLICFLFLSFSAPQRVYYWKQRALRNTGNDENRLLEINFDIMLHDEFVLPIISCN